MNKAVINKIHDLAGETSGAQEGPTASEGQCGTCQLLADAERHGVERHGVERGPRSELVIK